MTMTGQSQADAAAAFDRLLPLGRHTTPQEIAQAALYLASDASAMVTSTTFCHRRRPQGLTGGSRVRAPRVLGGSPGPSWNAALQTGPSRATYPR